MVKEKTLEEIEKIAFGDFSVEDITDIVKRFVAEHPEIEDPAYAVTRGLNALGSTVYSLVDHIDIAKILHKGLGLDERGVAKAFSKYIKTQPKTIVWILRKGFELDYSDCARIAHEDSGADYFEVAEGLREVHVSDLVITEILKTTLNADNSSIFKTMNRLFDHDLPQTAIALINSTDCSYSEFANIYIENAFDLKQIRYALETPKEGFKSLTRALRVTGASDEEIQYALDSVDLEKRKTLLEKEKFEKAAKDNAEFVKAMGNDFWLFLGYFEK